MPFTPHLPNAIPSHVCIPIPWYTCIHDYDSCICK